MPLTTTENEQVIEAVVSGPAPANRLYTCTGRAVVGMGAWGQGMMLLAIKQAPEPRLVGRPDAGSRRQRLRRSG